MPSALGGTTSIATDWSEQLTLQRVQSAAEVVKRLVQIAHFGLEAVHLGLEGLGVQRRSAWGGDGRRGRGRLGRRGGGRQLVLGV